MYVNKKLGGVNAVQTLSRLNRTHPEKKGTLVLDFANEADAIKAAFEPYYETTLLSEATDPNLLYEIQSRLAAFPVYVDADVRRSSTIRRRRRTSLMRFSRPSLSVEVGVRSLVSHTPSDRCWAPELNSSACGWKSPTRSCRIHAFLHRGQCWLIAVASQYVHQLCAVRCEAPPAVRFGNFSSVGLIEAHA